MVELARRVVEEQRVTATSHRLILEAHDGAIKGRWDQDRVAQAPTNLVNNAIKYPPSGGEVRVVIQRADGQARVSVHDQGIGIARDDIPPRQRPGIILALKSGVIYASASFCCYECSAVTLELMSV